MITQLQKPLQNKFRQKEFRQKEKKINQVMFTDTFVLFYTQINKVCA